MPVMRPIPTGYPTDTLRIPYGYPTDWGATDTQPPRDPPAR